MLIKCKECELQVSDKAISCPHCGYPINIATKSPVKRTKKRMRLPNGFGQISKLNGVNIRKPYRAMITVGMTSSGHYKQQLLKPVSYFATYNEAYEALVEYNRNPYDLRRSTLTVGDLYKEWSEIYFGKLTSDSSARNIKAAWSKCQNIANMPVRNLRVGHIKDVINNADTSENMKRRIKSMFNLMLDYAVEYEYVDKNYARDYTVEYNDSETASHMTYSDSEVNIILNSNDCMVKRIIMLQMLSGWRPQELCLIKLSDIDLRNMTITGGIKTDAGKNRVVPIHSSLIKYVKDWYKESENIGCDYLFHKPDGSPFTYNVLRHKYVSYIQENNLDANHRPHDGRKHFITLAKKYDVNEWVIKRLVGHSIQDVTEKVYTERNIDDLRNEIEKIRAQF